MAITVSSEEYIDINNIAEDLLGKYEYYSTVAFEYIEEAVAQTYLDTGMALDNANLEAYHKYISENLI